MDIVVSSNRARTLFLHPCKLIWRHSRHQVLPTCESARYWRTPGGHVSSASVFPESCKRRFVTLSSTTDQASQAHPIPELSRQNRALKQSAPCLRSVQSLSLSYSHN